MEKGTLYQLRNLLHRTSVPRDPEDNMKAAEDFLLVVLHAHATAAANEIQELLSSPESALELAKLIVTNYVYFPEHKELPKKNNRKKTKIDKVDKVNLYARELLTLSLLWHGFHDATCEGDGERLLTYWKFFMIIFKTANRHNYGKEAVNLILSQNFIFSDRKAMQLMWSRTVNTVGRTGCNIPNDLHQEHLNRRYKSIHSSLGSTNPKSATRAGKCVNVVHRICHAFEEETTGKTAASGCHSRPKFAKDFKLILKELKESQVFTPISSREHSSIKLECSLLQKLTRKELY